MIPRSTSFPLRTFLSQLLQPPEFASLPVEHFQVKRHPRQRAVELYGGRHKEAVDGLGNERVPTGLLRVAGPSRGGAFGPGKRCAVFTWVRAACVLVETLEAGATGGEGSSGDGSSSGSEFTAITSCPTTSAGTSTSVPQVEHR
ncbi:hypothetical protein [Bremerella volcania]|nr:hypothetical protein [Bremerella volcania]